MASSSASQQNTPQEDYMPHFQQRRYSKKYTQKQQPVYYPYASKFSTNASSPSYYHPHPRSRKRRMVPSMSESPPTPEDYLSTVSTLYVDGVRRIIQTIMSATTEEHPDDPLSFMIEHLESLVDLAKTSPLPQDDDSLSDTSESSIESSSEDEHSPEQVTTTLVPPTSDKQRSSSSSSTSQKLLPRNEYGIFSSSTSSSSSSPTTNPYVTTPYLNQITQKRVVDDEGNDVTQQADPFVPMECYSWLPNISTYDFFGYVFFAAVLLGFFASWVLHFTNDR
eukprot:CAMPEP_0117421698 /NCGR_PEP_ID=MMETSP0758-20121206/2712_1 /TAXON_ID=63605 /ORGANISM="Percolomonas cosmopolitus, Strain AE-1 (ATCC 50343)" /LENGTH=278 /DNA_ID=CAMNT_0005203927 /DNA_START=124 /DNA_END=956 /DNA_ORIENTATION=-